MVDLILAGVAIFFIGVISGCGISLFIAGAGKNEAMMEAFNAGREFERKRMEKDSIKSA